MAGGKAGAPPGHQATPPIFLKQEEPKTRGKGKKSSYDTIQLCGKTQLLRGHTEALG